MYGKTWLGMGLVIVLSLSASACFRGYADANELARNKRGPEECAKRCRDLGMRMGALVLMQRNYAGCVCEPAPGLTRNDPAEGGSAAALGTAVILMQQEQQRQQQQQAAAQQ